MLHRASPRSLGLCADAASPPRLRRLARRRADASASAWSLVVRAPPGSSIRAYPAELRMRVRALGGRARTTAASRSHVPAASSIRVPPAAGEAIRAAGYARSDGFTAVLKKVARACEGSSYVGSDPPSCSLGVPRDLLRCIAGASATASIAPKPTTCSRSRALREDDLPHDERVVAVVGLEAERVGLGVRERAVEILGRRLRDADRERHAALEGDVDADAVP